MTHLYRWTTWEDPDGGVRRMGLALLDGDWEPLRSLCAEVGPFDEVSTIRMELLQAMRLWIQTYGIQPPLPL